ncbi:hypothetical protein R6258_03620 [Halomonas sp. HP20-15]|uniref:hypothetical protein n=1 Tax=Halomonas sp. HP20-15 TaxID=3085901 RepID=UPI0029826213|nr:hypothetical protein [Halomonas sp. HP20-15]MDW5376003.1 hypothetical protein [Halomonas sp. HP20-15]
MRFVKLLFLLGVTAIYGCSTTGGTIGGLIPAPKLMKGKVENSIYYAMDGSFEIKTPFEQGSYSYKYMEVKEQYANVGAYVSFNTSVHPNEFYRVEIGKKLDKSQPSPTLDQLVNGLLQGYKQQLSGYGSKAKELQRIETRLDGKRAMLVTLEQAMPAQSSYQGRSPSYTVHHIIYIVESPNGGGGSVWVQWPHGCNTCASGKEADVISTSTRIKSFFKSFRLKI